MGRIARYLSVLTIDLLLTTAVHGADCYNDEVPARSDLEPPIPGSSADLLRVSDDDIASMLEAARAYEQKYAANAGAGLLEAPKK